MSWFVLVLSGVLEAVWATALGRSEGLSRLAPSIVFFVALALSMTGLGYAMRSLPVGTAYAAWVGVGAVLTVTYAMATGKRPRRWSRSSCWPASSICAAQGAHRPRLDTRDQRLGARGSCVAASR